MKKLFALVLAMCLLTVCASAEETNPSPSPLTQGELIEMADVCEFSVESFRIEKTILPPTTDGFYTYYEADEGKTYIDIAFTYKNLATAEVMADEPISAELLYAGQYVYPCFSIIEEDSRADFTYTNITAVAPLETAYIHYLFQVPEEVASTEGELLVILTVGGMPYEFILREGTQGDMAAPTEGAAEKAGGEVTEGELILLPGVGEFAIDHTEITNDVIPPQPDDFYLHYEAEEGHAYVNLCVAYRSFSGTPVMADEIIDYATLTYAGKYEYTGHSIIEEDSRSSFTYSNITSVRPLCKEYIHYLFDVPEEVAESEESLVIEFMIGGGIYTCTVR